MYGVVDLHFRRQIREQELVHRLPAASNLSVTIGQTVFAPNPQDAATAIYGHMNRSAAYLLLSQGGQSLQLHLECLQTRGSLSELKRELSKTIQIVLDAGRHCAQRVDRIGIAVYAENNRIAEGHFETFWRGVSRRFRETIVMDLLLAVTPAIIGAMFGLELQQAVITFVSTLIVALLWFMIEGTRREKDVTYEDV